MTSATPDITLYTFGSPNGWKISVTLEELSIPYKAEIVNVMTNTQKEPWYIKINPNGRIPAIKDGPLRVFESGAIMLYLTGTYDKDHKVSFPYGSANYWEMMSWLMFQMSGVGPMQGQAAHFCFYAKVKSEYAIERYIEETKRLLSVLGSRLKDHDYLVDEQYSIADIANYVWIQGADILDINLEDFPGVKGWIDRIGARDAVQKGLKVGAMVTREQMAENFRGLRAKIEAMDNSDKH